MKIYKLYKIINDSKNYIKIIKFWKVYQNKTIIIIYSKILL
jgi:hypothetical protein